MTMIAVWRVQRRRLKCLSWVWLMKAWNTYPILIRNNGSIKLQIHKSQRLVLPSRINHLELDDQNHSWSKIPDLSRTNKYYRLALLNYSTDLTCYLRCLSVIWRELVTLKMCLSMLLSAQSRCLRMRSSSSPLKTVSAITSSLNWRKRCERCSYLGSWKCAVTSSSTLRHGTSQLTF